MAPYLLSALPSLLFSIPKADVYLLQVRCELRDESAKMLTLSRSVFDRGSGGIQAPGKERHREKNTNHATVAVTRSAQREEEFSVVGTENGLMEAERTRFNRSGSWSWRRGDKWGLRREG